MISEVEKIRDRYERRKSTPQKMSATYNDFIVSERNQVYGQIINQYFPDKDTLVFCEVGAGIGSNLGFFKELGIRPENMYANELLDERVKQLQLHHPDIHIFPGDALKIDCHFQCDVLFLSTVFTSILDTDFQQSLANKLMKMLKPNGIILWYNFIYNNPQNQDVKKVSIKRVNHLFSSGCLTFGRKVTLAPPIGRKAGKAYPFFNFFTFLRSHYIAVIQKK